MNELKPVTFRKTEQIHTFEGYYLLFLNMLVTYRKSTIITTEMIAKAFNKSKASISNFETGKVIDFKFMYKYAGFLRFKFTISLNKMKYSEIMSL